jgi:hypothetical protein
MRKNEFKEGLGDLAARAEQDHEVQMARADLYKIAKYAIKLHDMLKGVSEAEGLEGWQQAKITKAADYIGSVYHNLDYDMKFGNGGNAEMEMPTESSYKETLNKRLEEKAVSKAQQRLMGMAYAVRKGDMPRSDASEEVLKLADGDMSTKELKKFASTEHKGKPEHVKKKD